MTLQAQPPVEFIRSYGGQGNYRFEDIYAVSDGEFTTVVRWQVTVVDPNAVDADQASLLPTEVTLYLAAPNPFNSRTSIR